MTNLLNTDARNPGPRALGHDPVVLPEQRKKLIDTIEKSGVVKFRRSGDPALPFVKNPKR